MTTKYRIYKQNIFWRETRNNDELPTAGKPLIIKRGNDAYFGMYTGVKWVTEELVVIDRTEIEAWAYFTVPDFRME